MADIDKLKEGVKRIALAEPVVALAPFMGQVADAAVDAYGKAKDYVDSWTRPTKRAGDIELPKDRRRRRPLKTKRTLGDIYGK